MYPIKMSLLTKICTLLLAVAALGCATDDPMPIFRPAEPNTFKASSNTLIEPIDTLTWERTYAAHAADIFEPEPLYAAALTDPFSWMERSTTVIALQQILGATADGVYGPRTRQAHVAMLVVFNLPVSGVPDKPAGSLAHYPVPDPVADGPFWDNVERWRSIVTEAVFAWGGDEADVHRFLRIMQCESAGIPTAKNPSSSASGLMQQLAHYWPERASGAGVPGADVFDPYANVWVSAWLALAAPDGGWGHWVCK